MSEERDIEKQLRAYAEKRRKDAGEPFEMHPATRRMLQGEVQRVHGGKAVAAEQRSPLFARLWWRFAAGVCTAAILAVGTWMFFRSHEQPKQVAMLTAKPELRKAETADQAQRPASPAENAPAAVATGRADSGVAAATTEPVASPAIVPAAAPPPAPVLLAESKVSDERLDVVKMMTTHGSMNAAAPPVPEVPAGQNRGSLALGLPSGVKDEGGKFDETKAGGKDVAAAKLAYAAVPGTKGEMPEQPAQGERQIYNFSNAAFPADTTVSQAVFANAQSKAKVASKPAGESVLLASFQVEQTGNQIRIIDRDGSTYDGVLLASTDDKEAALRKFEVAKSLATLESLPRRREQMPVQSVGGASTTIQNLRFACSGTNLSLNQRVAISGEIVGLTNLAANLGPQKAQTDQFKAAAQGGAWLSNGRIVGKAVTADGREIELNATQMPSY